MNPVEVARCYDPGPASEEDVNSTQLPVLRGDGLRGDGLRGDGLRGD